MTPTASALGVRRQTLHNRPARMEEPLGASRWPTARHTALGVALHAWQLRTVLDPGQRLSSQGAR